VVDFGLPQCHVYNCVIIIVLSYQNTAGGGGGVKNV